MRGLPCFLCTGACARSRERCTRRSCSRRCASIFSSRARCRRSFSFCFSATSTKSSGIWSMMARYSSSLASMLVSICRELWLASASNPQRTYTSVTLEDRSSSDTSFPLSTPFVLRVARSISALPFSSSILMADWRTSICACRPSVSASMRCFVSRYFIFSSSSASSVSWQFWIRNRFCSSSCAKMSSSCWGFWKYMGMSSKSSSSSSSSGSGGGPGGGGGITSGTNSTHTGSFSTCSLILASTLLNPYVSSVCSSFVSTARSDHTLI
mmetsp:Transcript_12014/g.25255  ORF Transcript_12014/g.25255 Transcript_12014/m.25255 type:complete len:268 (+) Transcript_12014:335-1138(+)